MRGHPVTAGTALSRRGALAGTARARATHSATRRSRSRSGTGTAAPADDSVTERNTLLRDEGGLIADAVMWSDAPLGAMNPAPTRQSAVIMASTVHDYGPNWVRNQQVGQLRDIGRGLDLDVRPGEARDAGTRPRLSVTWRGPPGELGAPPGNHCRHETRAAAHTCESSLSRWAQEAA